MGPSAPTSPLPTFLCILLFPSIYLHVLCCLNLQSACGFLTFSLRYHSPKTALHLPTLAAPNSFQILHQDAIPHQAPRKKQLSPITSTISSWGPHQGAESLQEGKLPAAPAGPRVGGRQPQNPGAVHDPVLPDMVRMLGQQLSCCPSSLTSMTHASVLLL